MAEMQVFTVISEINNLMEYEKVVLNKSISNSLFAYNGDVTWIFKGEEREYVDHLIYIGEQ